MEQIKSVEVDGKFLTIMKFDYGYEVQLSDNDEIIDTDGFYDIEKTAEEVLYVWFKELIKDELQKIVWEKLRQIDDKNKINI